MHMHHCYESQELKRERSSTSSEVLRPGETTAGSSAASGGAGGCAAARRAARYCASVARPSRERVS